MDTPRAVLKPLVLEFGAAYTKIGYVGEPEPRHIIKTELTLKSGKQVGAWDINNVIQLFIILIF